MASKYVASVFGLFALCAVQPVYADPVTWASFTSDNGSTNNLGGQVNGNIGSVGVTFTGDYSFADLNNTGPINYWQDPVGNYTPVLDAPTANSDIIGLSDASPGTITFSQTVQNVFIAFNSFNGASVNFFTAPNVPAPFTIISQGCGYWGCGSFSPFASNTAFNGDGELVGVLEFQGQFNSLSFFDSVTENWHGIDIGTSGPVSNSVPEPITLSLFGAGLAGAAALRRRKKKTA